MKHSLEDIVDILSENKSKISILEELQHELSLIKTSKSKELADTLESRLHELREKKSPNKVQGTQKTFEPEGPLIDYIQKITEENKEIERIKNLSMYKKVEDEIKKLQTDINKDVSFLKKVYRVKPIATWMKLCGVLGTLLGITSLFDIVFFANPHIEDRIVNLTGFLIGGGFGLYIYHRDRAHTHFLQRYEYELKQKREKLELLQRLKK